MTGFRSPDYVIAYMIGTKGKYLTKSKIEPVLEKKFGETIMKGAITWYTVLPKNSISSFFEIEKAFIKAHTGS